MSFQPAPGYEIKLKKQTFQVSEHPNAPGMVFGQEGRQAIVYQLENKEGEKRALKVFKDRFRTPSLVSLSDDLEPLASLPGMKVCKRTVLTPSRHPDLLSKEADLIYAVLMPWVEGPTWQEILLEGRPLTKEQSLKFARSLTRIMLSLEEKGVAHCDLSGANVILSPDFSEPELALVDVEGVFAPGLPKPEVLFTGSPGYGHNLTGNGIWNPQADRFAGAVMLAEILGWCLPEVRQEAYGEHYFNPQELQTDCERYQILVNVLEDAWGDEVVSCLKRSWISDLLEDCPTFGEWNLVLDKLHVEKSSQTQTQATPAGIADSDTVSAKLTRLILKAEKAVREGDISVAIALYNQAAKNASPDLKADLRERLDSLMRTQARDKDWYCPDCDLVVPAALDICPSCEETTRPAGDGSAADLAAAQEAQEEVKAWQCPECDTLVPTDLTVCQNCEYIRGEGSASSKPRRKSRSAPRLKWGWVGGLIGGLLLAMLAILYFSGVITPPTMTPIPSEAAEIAATGPVSTPTPELPLNASRVVKVTGSVISLIPGGEEIKVKEGSILSSGQGSLIRTEDGHAKLVLADGSVIYMDEYSELELTEIADTRSQATDTNLKINYGRVLSQVSLEPEFSFTVNAPTGAWAMVTGSIMSVSYDPDDNQRFDMDCIEGHCILGGVNSGDELPLEGGFHSYLYTSGSPNEPDQSWVGSWEDLVSEFGDDSMLPKVVTWTPTPTIEGEEGDQTPTPTPTYLPTVVVSTDVPPTWTPSPTPVCYTLTTSVTNGSISVSPSPNCGSKYESGTTLTLTANPNSGYNFQNWSGNLSGSANPETLVMNGNKSVTANIAEPIPDYSLTTSINPSGSGSVTPSSGTYQSGTEVCLTASPSSGYVFSNWSGGVSGSSNPICFNMTGDKNVTANFLACVSLSLYSDPSGGGNLNATSPNCGSKYTPGTSITVTQTENSSYYFDYWSGACSGASCSFTINSNTSVTAHYNQCFPLSLSRTGSGSIPVPSPSASSGCPGGYFHPGASISLTASPSSGYEVGSWTGTTNNASTSTTNTVSMPSGSHSASVNYVQPCYSLTRTHTGSGSDPVASPTSSSGCTTGKYHAGESISLSASPSTGYTVGSWNGTNNNSSTSTSNTATMPNGNHTVTVNYACSPYSLDINVTGYGSVSKSPSPNCGSGYSYGTSVQLTANPDNQWSYFDKWTGDKNSSSNPVNITMDGNKSVTADFDEYAADEVTGLGFNFLGVSGGKVGYFFYWDDASHEQYYDLWMRNDTGTENSTTLPGGSDYYSSTNFFDCAADTAWFTVTSVNPYSTSGNATWTVYPSSRCP